MSGMFRFDELEEQRRLEEQIAIASGMGNRFNNTATQLLFSQVTGVRPGTSALAPQNLAAAAEARRSLQDAAFLSMLEGNSNAAANRASALSNSPFYQRQPAQYHRPFLPSDNQYLGLTSAAESPLYGRRPSTYGGYQPPVASPADQRFNQSPYGLPTQATSQNFGNFYGRQAQDLSQAALTDHAYGNGVQNRIDDEMSASKAPQPSTLAASYLPKGQLQSPKAQNMPSASSPTKSPGPGRGGRGGGRGRGRGRGGGRGSGGRGRGGRGTSLPKPSSAQRDYKNTEAEVIDEGPPIQWYPGCVPLGLPEDKYWLSELQVYLRSNFAEAFGATEDDIAAPMHGRNKPIALGQVGIRCVHCREDPPSERGQQATSYPSLISGIYNSVQQMLRLHFDCCLAMPAEVRKKIEALKVSSSARGGRKQYWIDSANRLGLVDTPHGIHFGRDPYEPPPPLEGPSVATMEKKKAAKGEKAKKKAGKEGEEEVEGDVAAEIVNSIPDMAPEDLYPLVLPEDKALISDYLYLTLEQMQPCLLMEADRVGCYKAREVGFHGLACKHCVGQAGCGRYFPASEASLSQTTTSQTIMNHVRNCRRCPIEIRENLELMKRARMGPDGKRADKPKHGGRKVFFRRLWCRVQGLPMDDETIPKKRMKNTYTRGRGRSPRKGQRRSPSSDASSDSDGSDDELELDDPFIRDNSMDDDDVTETEDEETESSSDDEDESEEESKLQSLVSASASNPKKKASTLKKSPKYEISKWHEGCVRLTKSDDPHWLSEMQCYVRSELVEVFSLDKKDPLDGYGGRKEPATGQVGIRCAFCKSLPKAERPVGYLSFPDCLSSIHGKVGDLIRLHFPNCPGMPDEVKNQFKSLRGFGAKADGEAQQYWIDSARDIGLNDFPPTPDGWGITFRRDPLQPSPADEIDRENAGAATYVFSKSMMIRADDRGMCTDHVMLLLRQVKPCRFKKSDRRGGPGARGRDRVIGYPGLCCKHCTTKNNFGRYFPVSAKNLTDNTTNSLQGHVSSCSRCPEPIKASLAYLTHRSVLQKAELSGSWKKSFFKRVWDRLHIERAWNNPDGELKEDGSVSSEGIQEEVESNVVSGGSGSGSEDEDEVTDDMQDMIHAAAEWLCELEKATVDDSSRARSTSRSRVLPSKRSLPFSPPRARGRGGALIKRRRIAVPS
jgi:hypothetical protein